MKARFSALVLALSFLFTPASASTTSSHPAIFPLVTAVPYNIEEAPKPRNICTVTRIKSVKNIYLTAAHCVDLEHSDRTYNIASLPAFPKVVDKAGDFAIFEVPGDEPMSGLEFSEVAPKSGDSISLVGYPLNLQTALTFSGTIAAPITVTDTGFFMIYSISACKGNSGSVVLDKDGKIISILTIGLGDPCSSVTGGPTFNKLQDFRLLLASLGY